MKLSFLLSLLLSIPFSSAASPSGNLYFAERPSLSPSADIIYFSYDGDIFSIPSSGGLAMRLVNLGGIESHPIASPDGKWIALSSSCQGNSDVYIVPANGGEAIRLTYNQATDIPSAWDKDSRILYIQSNRENNASIYSISIDGGTPRRLFPNYFNTITNFSQNPLTGEFYFNESSESHNFPTRKGYKGDHNPNIKSWNPSTKQYTQYTTYRGKDTWPMVDCKGRLYYVSDSLNGESNIFQYIDSKSSKALTRFKASIQFPSISYNGEAIVFLKDYKIQCLDIASGKVHEPQISIVGGPVESISSFADQSPSSYSVSPDGKKMALVIRGLLYIADVKGKYLQVLETPKDERVSEILWSRDNNTIYYLRTNRGIPNIYTIKADGSEAEKAIFTSTQACQSLSISHKGDRIVFICGNRDLMTIVGGKASKLGEAEFWSFRSPEIQFSYDDNYICFTAMDRFESDIFLYSFTERILTNLTRSACSEGSPVFSPDGKYLFFTANLNNATFPGGGGSRTLYKLPLKEYDTPFESDKYDNLFKTPAPAKDSIVVIDFSRIFDRLIVQSGQCGYTAPFTFCSGKKSWLMYSASPAGSTQTFILELSDPDSKPKAVKDAVIYAFFSSDKDLYGLGRDGTLYKLDPASAAASKLSFKADVGKNLKDEFTQMFYETWGALYQNFYDPNFHGVDWQAKRDYYADFLPYVKSRNHLRYILRDMLGELNSSHLGFSTRGEEEKVHTPYTTLSYETGIIFSNDNPYVLDYILPLTPASKVELDLKPGDRLVAVNGQRIDPKENRNKYFSSPIKLSEMKMVWNRGGQEFTTKIHCFPCSEMRNLFYTQWEDECRQKVEDKGNGRVAYIHMRDMGGDALKDFLRRMHTDACNKDALILDLRFNNGGNVHQEVLDFLRRKAHFRWAFRDFPRTSHHNITPADKPIIVLVNERSLSDAEVTSNGIKSLGIAKIVGTETYRWIIFTTSYRMVDGSSCRLPSWGCYTLEGKDLESTGVSPDIYVNNTFADRLAGRDPQLERAIEEILKMM